MIVPNYYHKFQCIAHRCEHSCCIGWEIDIDAFSMSDYASIDTPFGERIRRNICMEPQPHFVLQEGERCPFLLENGLCEMILTLGEDALCDICAEHPRFYHTYENDTEAGLGLCCEAVARLILSETEPFSLQFSHEWLTKEEKDFMEERQVVFSVLQDRGVSFAERVHRLQTQFFLPSVSPKQLREVYLSLERLEEAWTEELNALSSDFREESVFVKPEFQVPLEQLACYFLFRHFSPKHRLEAVRFTLDSCRLLGAMWNKHLAEHGEITLDEMADYARRYSAEVEYSEENMEVMLQPDKLHQSLLSNRDEEYRNFHCKLIPTVPLETVMGVRVPVLRRLAKELSLPQSFLESLPHGLYEENQVHSFVIAEIRDYEQCISEVNRFLPYVDNWAVCDSLRPKCFGKHLDVLMKQIDIWLASSHSYTVRFGIEMLMVWYLDDCFAPEYLEKVAAVSLEEYYVKMMVAWYFATALAKQWEQTLPYLQEQRLPLWIHQKTIQKAVESNRLTLEQKKQLKSL